ncbi:MAG: METTL5 family protein [Nanoarchaeota archaeon]|nr:METTL5 family protein [Nanoarchaeota archaeon]MBU1445057.1 METTL5 family protein [Nanoarchaeota archaeon]MBU2406934.1 METTL5 family protein [Nanoarchaeota archaeon]MBU2420604.1 METTL5 family protein [Nanoarchaeota archaeon]MBU2475184.1 METTL5 family protein [Nanoarchaeota archaeon]
MNKKQLAIFLSKLKKVEKPKVELEQYSTDEEIVAHILWHAFLHEDIEEKVIADFGCGNGIFGIGCLALNAKKVYFVDKDEESIEIAKANCGFNNVEFLNIDISEFKEKVDLVIQNPPFGVQNRKADKPFLEKAMQVADKIYTIHKIESKGFINVLCEENGFLVNGIIGFDFPIKKSMEFHKKKEHKVRVGCWILEKRKL